MSADRRRKNGSNIVVVGDSGATHQGFGLGDYYVGESDFISGKVKRGRKKVCCLVLWTSSAIQCHNCQQIYSFKVVRSKTFDLTGENFSFAELTLDLITNAYEKQTN